MSSGEKDLKKLLKNMVPRLREGEYVFCSLIEGPLPDQADILCSFREEEGLTLVLEKKLADRLRLSYGFISAWITLTVHSALEAVGLTAAVSNALADRGISCNVIAAYYHDHIFVPAKDAALAMETLRELSGIT
jgi:hypothetical protein